MQIADTIAGGSGDNKTALAGPLDVANPPAGAGFRPGKRRDPGGEIMGFSGKQRMIVGSSPARAGGLPGLL